MGRVILYPAIWLAPRIIAVSLTAFVYASDTKGQASPPTTVPGHPTQTPPEQSAPKPIPTSPVPEAPHGSLSEKLSRQNGVLKPPTGIDPEMPELPPANGTLRVIPPPDSAGGSTHVKPK